MVVPGWRVHEELHGTHAILISGCVERADQDAAATYSIPDPRSRRQHSGGVEIGCVCDCGAQHSADGAITGLGLRVAWGMGAGRHGQGPSRA